MVNGKDKGGRRLSRSQLDEYIFDMLGQLAAMAEEFHGDLADNIRSLIQDHAADDSPVRDDEAADE